MAISTFFTYPKIIHRLHDGPLGSYIDRYALQLRQQGFSQNKARRNIRLIADLSRWLEREKLDVDDLNEHTLKRFDRFRTRTRPLGGGDPSALRNFLGLLRELEVCPPPVPCLKPRSEQVEEAFRSYLTQDIGLSAGTLIRYSDLVREFIQEQLDTKNAPWSELTTANIVDFLQRLARWRSRQYMQRLRTALRSFLRYLLYCGEIHADLSDCIPTVRSPQLSTIPKYLSEHQVQSMLDACDRSTPIGRRDYAILLLLARLGLRANEVATLSLDKIDWQTGQLILKTKGAAEYSVMPLPLEVGDSIIDYLKNGRPRSRSRHVFLRHNAPHDSFSSSDNVSMIVRSTLTRAGIESPSKGAHVLRHTLATQMLRRGSSLMQIGHLLGHRRPDTTRIYAKVDLTALRSVALPWPEDV